jgi:dTDP-4-amino-4,6-dideoxygalactose transaminase
MALPRSDFESILPFLFFTKILHDKRDEFRVYLKSQGIDTGIHWQPGHSFKLFAHCKRGDLTITEKISKQIVSLPLHSKMADDDLDKVLKAANDFGRYGI